jgi:hypothetical protein
MAAPKYRSISREDIPVIDESKTRVHIIAGKYNGTPGAIEGDYVKALYLDVELEPGTEWVQDTEATDTLFVYILQGEAFFGPESGEYVREKHAVLFNEGREFKVKTQDKGIRLLLMSGKRLNEPIAWGGPIVMNTREELDLAFRELENNTFIK